jgi:hypothetical protein
MRNNTIIPQAQNINEPLDTTSYYDNIPIIREWIKKTIISYRHIFN